jgi:hypothetical protein
MPPALKPKTSQFADRHGEYVSYDSQDTVGYFLYKKRQSINLCYEYAVCDSVRK